MAVGTPGALEATFIVGPYGIIEDVDAAVTPLLGYPRDEVIGQHGSMLVPRDVQPSTAVVIDRMRRGEVALSAGRLVRRDGSEFHVEVRSRTLPEGRIVLLVRERAPDATETSPAA
jgi:PAS domain S-box-containing protein